MHEILDVCVSRESETLALLDGLCQLGESAANN